MPQATRFTDIAIGLSRDEVHRAMTEYAREIDRIAVMIPSGTILVRGAGEHVRDAVTQLKQRIRVDRKRRETQAGVEAMSDVENRFLWPAIMQAHVDLQQIRVNTNPGPDWLEALHSTASEFSYWLCGLEESESA